MYYRLGGNICVLICGIPSTGSGQAETTILIGQPLIAVMLPPYTGHLLRSASLGRAAWCGLRLLRYHRQRWNRACNGRNWRSVSCRPYGATNSGRPEAANSASFCKSCSRPTIFSIIVDIQWYNFVCKAIKSFSYECCTRAEIYQFKLFFARLVGTHQVFQLFYLVFTSDNIIVHFVWIFTLLVDAKILI